METIVVALITGGLSLLGVIITSNKTAPGCAGQAGQAAGRHRHQAGRADPGRAGS